VRDIKFLDDSGSEPSRPSDKFGLGENKGFENEETRTAMQQRKKDQHGLYHVRSQFNMNLAKVPLEGTLMLIFGGLHEVILAAAAPNTGGSSQIMCSWSQTNFSHAVNLNSELLIITKIVQLCLEKLQI
jgi:hypothetical protein